jgi:large subunit ribosomal protein L4
MAVATYTKSGTKAATAAKLDKSVFGVEVKSHDLLKQAYVAYLANGRVNLAKTKNRGDVSGGGRKPWKQKGTGRARFGSSRNPIWRGGGIAFGPTGAENYTHRLPLNAKRQAIRQALSLAAGSDSVIVVETIDLKGKTADAAKFLDKIGATKQVLVVVADKTTDMVRATNNLSNVTLVQARYVNVFDALNADQIVLTTDALDILTEWLGGKA